MRRVFCIWSLASSEVGCLGQKTISAGSLDQHFTDIDLMIGGCRVGLSTGWWCEIRKTWGAFSSSEQGKAWFSGRINKTTKQSQSKRQGVWYWQGNLFTALSIFCTWTSWSRNLGRIGRIFENLIVLKKQPLSNITSLLVLLVTLSLPLMWIPTAPS